MGIVFTMALGMMGRLAIVGDQDLGIVKEVRMDQGVVVIEGSNDTVRIGPFDSDPLRNMRVWS